MFFKKAKTIGELEARVSELEAMLTPEMRQLDQLNTAIDSAKQEASNYTDEILKLKKQHASLMSDIDKAKQSLVETEEEVLLQAFGFYKPRYAFANSTGYKDELDNVRKKQKDMIKTGTAALGNDSWTVNGNAAKGKKMVKDMQKLLIRAFNSECDDCVEHVKFNNIESMEKRITSAKDAISKLGAIMGISISRSYYDLKIQELHLAHEYQQKKQEEKEYLKQLRAEERERAKLEKEIETERKKITKEQTHYSNALQKILKQIEIASTPDEMSALEDKKAEIETHLKELNDSLETIDYREANQRAGYVYIISNIGSFGEGVYKIGMTRRLDPMDRVDELGDASVPFDFDVHALIFSDDAPALEAALHHAFEDRKLNMINTRREFFRVSLEEIKDVVLRNYDKTVEFIEIPPAEQYRETLVLQNKK